MKKGAGFTLAETLTVMMLIAVLGSITIPPLARMREAASVDSGRSQVTAALWLSRSVGTQWGRTAVLSIDTLSDILTVRVDTSGLMGSADSVVVREFRLGEELRIDLGADRSALCFNSRGIGVTSGSCPALGAVITVTRNGRVDSVRVNSAGRVW